MNGGTGTGELRGRFREYRSLVRAVVAESRRQQVTFLAAAVAYFAFVSLVPLALLGVALGSLVAGSAMAAGVTDALGKFLTAEGKTVLTTAMTGTAGRGGATVVGVVVLLWGGLRLFRGIDRAFGQVYGTGAPSLRSQVLDAATVLFASVVGVGALVGVGTAIAQLQLPPVAGVAGVGAVWVTLVVAFLPLYYVFPDVDVSVREALPGTVLAATGYTALATLFGTYTTVAGSYALYGLLGAVLLLLTWLYLGAVALLVGAVLNAVHAGRVGDWPDGTDRPT